ncbi:MAG: hypothetical protein IT223_07430, partial [Crocinitomicaceae bacterium]|nr:hypothetical protein [Crocinitomicaceae bacterium]
MRQFRFTISRKLGIGFGLIILIAAFVFLLTNITLNESRDINQRINQEYAPSLKALSKLDALLLRSQDLARQWTFVQRIDNHRDRREFKLITDSLIPKQLEEVKKYSVYWPVDERENSEKLEADVISLIVYY